MQILDWFLREENAKFWAEVRALAVDNKPASYETLKKYALEAGRFQVAYPTSWVVHGESVQVKDDAGKDVTVKKGEIIMTNNVSSCSPTLCYMLYAIKIFLV